MDSVFASKLKKELLLGTSPVAQKYDSQTYRKQKKIQSLLPEYRYRKNNRQKLFVVSFLFVNP